MNLPIPKPRQAQEREDVCLADLNQIAGWHALLRPWSPEAKARRKAHTAVFETLLASFLDGLAALRQAKQSQQTAAAERILLESEVARHANLSAAHLKQTERFVAQLSVLDQLNGPTTPELRDALKQRALEELTRSMNRVSERLAGKATASAPENGKKPVK